MLRNITLLLLAFLLLSLVPVHKHHHERSDQPGSRTTMASTPSLIAAATPTETCVTSLLVGVVAVVVGG